MSILASSYIYNDKGIAHGRLPWAIPLPSLYLLGTDLFILVQPSRKATELPGGGISRNFVYKVLNGRDSQDQWQPCLDFLASLQMRFQEYPILIPLLVLPYRDHDI